MPDVVTVAGGSLFSVGSVGRVGNVSSVGTVNKVNTLGEVLALPEIRIRSVECPKVNDRGITTAARWKSLGATIVAIGASAINLQIARDRNDTAKIYLNLAKDAWAFFEDNYKPLELQELSEINSEGIKVPEYLRHITGMTQHIPSAFVLADRQVRAAASKYCIDLDPSVSANIALHRSYSTGNATNFARSYAVDRAQKRSDVRWGRRLSAAARGRGLNAQSSKFASAADASFAQVAGAVSGVAEGAARYLGYQSAARPPQYPTRRMDVQSFAANRGTSMGDTSNTMEATGWDDPFGGYAQASPDDILGSNSNDSAYGMSYSDQT